MIDQQAFDTLSQQIRDTFAEMVFQLSAQGALGALLRADDDNVRATLTRRTNTELERISNAARALTTLVDGLLEDRETATVSPE